MELHEIRTTVEIDHVKLNVRFPGQLSFQFKNGILYLMQTSFTKTLAKCVRSSEGLARLEKRLVSSLKRRLMPERKTMSRQV
jgi:hypothetical protein